MPRGRSRRRDGRPRICLRLEQLEQRAMLAFVPEMIRDFNTSDYDGSEPHSFFEFGDKAYFSARSVDEGRETWVTDGTEAGTELLKDIAPGKADSLPGSFATVPDGFLFVADDAEHGRELWFSDGTSEGTHLVKDILPGDAGSILALQSVGSQVLFFVHRTEWRWELWRSDGTENGTIPISIFESDVTGPEVYWPKPVFYVESTDKLFFATNKQLWVSEGTAESTRVLKAFEGNERLHWEAFVASDDSLYFSVSEYADEGPYSLWRSDGTVSGTGVVRDLESHRGGGEFVESGGIVYFSAGGANSYNWSYADVELWRTDGTHDGTWQVADIAPGTKSSRPSKLSIMNGDLYFFADDGVHGNGLYRSDGTATGTVRLTDVFQEVDVDAGIAILGDTLYFSAPPVAQRTDTLWQSDGTIDGTHVLEFPVDTMQPRYPARLTAAGNTLYFVALSRGRCGSRRRAVGQ